MLPKGSMEAAVGFERSLCGRKDSLEMAWFQSSSRSFEHWHQDVQTAQADRFGEVASDQIMIERQGWIAAQRKATTSQRSL